MKIERILHRIVVLWMVLLSPFTFHLSPLMAQTSMLSIGVRGGGQTYLPTAAVGATGEVKPVIGGAGALDLRYSFYGDISNNFELGFGLGVGFGYGMTALKGTSTDTYSNTDYLGNQMDYTVTSKFKQLDKFAKIDLALLCAMRFGGVTLNIGPRLMMPISARRSFIIHEANIDAYYPTYNVHVVNQLITGKLDNSQCTMHNSQCAIPKYTLLMCAEIGYEWSLNNTNAIGVQAFADIAVWSSSITYPLSSDPLIQVAPITNAANPVPKVEVGSIESFVSHQRYVGFGVRAYYAFSMGPASSKKKYFRSGRDTYYHRNRYYR